MSLETFVARIGSGTTFLIGRSTSMSCIRERCGSLYGLLDLKVLQRHGSRDLASNVKKGISIRLLRALHRIDLLQFHIDILISW